MKLHINMPDVAKGTELEVMHVGLVKQGETVELTESQVAAFEEAGYDVSGDSMNVYNVPAKTEEEEVKTTNLPGIEVIAERERAKTSRRSSKEGGK